MEDGPWFAQILREYKRCGFMTAIDDFGAGDAGLTLLADFQPDLIKLDMALVRSIDTSPARQSIASNLMRMCTHLGVQVIAEGIETANERDFFHDAGIRLMQGYLFARWSPIRQMPHIQMALGNPEETFALLHSLPKSC